MFDRVVTLYAAPGCPLCAAARELLRKRAIEFGDVEVREEEDVRELIRLTGGTVVPTLVVGDDVQAGWDADRFAEMLDDPLPLGDEELTIALAEAEVEVAQQEQDALREAQEAAERRDDDAGNAED